jgi:peptide subunit release factor 1 (eRF1)
MRIQAGQSIILAIDLQDRLLGTLPPARRTPLLHNITRLLAGSPRAVAAASRDAEQQQPALERLRQAGVTVAVG